jgi:hypothetical protein
MQGRPRWLVEPAFETTMHDPMSLDFEHDPAVARRRYALCRAGFLFGAVGLALLGLSSMLTVLIIFYRDPDLIRIAKSQWWHWGVGAPITWTTIVSAYLLWGRWADASWQRRAGVLLLLNTFDLIFWILQNNKALGLRLGDVGNTWLLPFLTEGCGWVEFMLFGSLAAEVATRPGSDTPNLLRNGVFALSALGLVVCVLTFATNTDWARGWPLGQRPFNPALLLSYLASNLLMTMAAMQLVALMGMAARQSGRYRDSLKYDDPMPDLLISRSETEWENGGERPSK